MVDIYLRSAGHFIPEKRLTNEDVMRVLEEENRDVLSEEELRFVHYGNKRKLEFLGGETRAVVGENEGYVDMAVQAARRAIENAEMSSDQLDAIIATGISNPLREPSLSVVVAHELGLNSGVFFDINDACNGFMKSLRVASLYIESGRCKNVLVVACESPFEMKGPLQADLRVDHVGQIDNKFSNLMLGSGAGACILSVQGERRRLVNLNERMESVDWDASLITFPGIKIPMTRYGKTALNGFWTDARKISSKWRQGSVQFVLDSMEEWGTTGNDYDLVLLHQLGDNVTFSILKQLNIDKNKAPLNTFNELGNLGAANIPVLLSIASEKEIAKTGHTVLLISGGGGFSYSAAHIAW